MKKIVIVIALLLITAITINAQDSTIKNFAKADKGFIKQLNAVLESYYPLKDALVKTSASTAATSATELANTLGKVTTDKLTDEQKTYFTGHSGLLTTQLQLIAGSSDVEVQRKAFEQVSICMYALIKSFKANAETVYRQYCPMAFKGKGAYWLSDSEEVINPYFGNKMLHCGSVEEEF